MSKSNKRRKRIGRMEPLRIMRQNPDATPDSFGQTVEDEVEFIRRRGTVLEMRGGEQVINGQIESDTTHLVYMHGSDTAAKTITSENWIRRTSVGNSRLNILAVRMVGTDGMEIELRCKERLEP